MAMEHVEPRLWEKLKEVIDPGANLNAEVMDFVRAEELNKMME